MPKTNLIGKDRIGTQLDKISKQIRIAIISGEELQNKARSETIQHSGMSPASFYTAWKNPSLFRVGQLVRIYDFLKIPDEERRFT